MRFCLAMLALCAASVAIADSDPPRPAALADVPFSSGRVDARPWVAVTFGSNAPVSCIIDTGSDVGIINTSLSGGSETLSRSYVIVAGGRVPMDRVRVRDVAIGDARVKFADFVRRDRSWGDPKLPMPCVIGASFLDRFTVEIDMPAERLRLYPRGTSIASLSGTAQPDPKHFDRVASGRVIAKARIGSHEATALIDTGWIDSRINQALFDALEIDPDDPTIESRRIGAQRTLRLLDLGPIVLAGIDLGARPVDIGHLGEVAGLRSPLLHVGVDLLAGHRLLVDMSRHEAALLP